MLAAVTLTMGVNATTLNEDGHFYCDFSLGDEDFNPWTVVSDGNDDGRWGGLETSQMAPVHFGGYDESDDYLFSPKITLPQGKEYGPTGHVICRSRQVTLWSRPTRQQYLK